MYFRVKVKTRPKAPSVSDSQMQTRPKAPKLFLDEDQAQGPNTTIIIPRC